MSFSVQPDEVIGIADRVRLALDDALDRSDALRDAVHALSEALARLPAARAAFDDVALPRVGVSRGIVGHGRSVVDTLRSIVRTYVETDDEMASATDRSSAQGSLFDPSRFGSRAP